LRTSVGAATGNHRGTKSMSEVQEPLLEHTPTEAQNSKVNRQIGVLELHEFGES